MKRYQIKARKHDELKLAKLRQGKRRESKYHGEVARRIRSKKRNLRHPEKKSIFFKLFPWTRKEKSSKRNLPAAVERKKLLPAIIKPKKPITAKKPSLRQFAPYGQRRKDGKLKTVYIVRTSPSHGGNVYEETKVFHDFGNGFVITKDPNRKGYVLTEVTTGTVLRYGTFNPEKVKDMVEEWEMQPERMNKIVSQTRNMLSSAPSISRFEKMWKEAKAVIPLPKKEKTKIPLAKSPAALDKAVFAKTGWAPKGKRDGKGKLKTAFVFLKGYGDEPDRFKEMDVKAELGNGLTIIRDPFGKKRYFLLDSDSGLLGSSRDTVNGVIESLDQHVIDTIAENKRKMVDGKWTGNQYVKAQTDEGKTISMPLMLASARKNIIRK